MNPINVTPQSFKPFNQLMILNFRMGLGPLFTGMLGQVGHIMVLTTLGRKSGRKRRTPVNYAILRGGVYCVAGFGQQADWFRNARANPTVQVWIGNQSWAGQAELVTDPDEWLLAYRVVMINSGFAAQAFMGLDPSTASDDVLRKAGASTPLVRINLERPISEGVRPGDLLWAWPVMGTALIALLWLIKRTRN